MEHGQLTELVSSWCRRVEFPISVDDLGTRTAVEAEQPEQFAREFPDVTERGAKFVVRAFPVSRRGIEGEFYVLARIDQRGESWAEGKWAQQDYPKMHPQAVPPQMPGSLTCLHGIALTAPPYRSWYWAARLDHRGDTHPIALSRAFPSNRLPFSQEEFHPDLMPLLEHILEEHLTSTPRATGNDAWAYKQELIDPSPLSSFWDSIPGTIRVYTSGNANLLSLKEVQDHDLLTTTVHRSEMAHLDSQMAGLTPGALPAWDTDGPTLTSADLSRLSSSHRIAIFANRFPHNVRWLLSGHLATDWSLSPASYEFFRETDAPPVSVVPLPHPATIGTRIHKTTDDFLNHCLLNADHPFVKWLVRAEAACNRGDYGLDRPQFRRLYHLLHNPLGYRGIEVDALTQYVNAWRELPGLPLELCPPDIQLTAEMFDLP